MTFDFDTIHDRANSDSIKYHWYPADVLPMWVADMDFRSPQAVIDALHARVEEGIFGYSFGPKDLNKTIADRLKRLYNWEVEPDAIVMLSGLVSGLNVAARTAGELGDGVLINPPVYGPFHTAPTNQGRVLQKADMVLRVADDGRMRYAVDFGALEAAVTERTRMIILCNPQNPVGTVYTAEELQRFADIAERHDLIICSDEIHCDLLLDGAQHQPIAGLSPDVAKRTITLMAPSKTFNLPGLGASFAVIQDKELRDRFNTAAAGIVPHTSLLSLVAMEAAYTRCDDWLAALRVYLTANRDFAVEYVRTHMPKARFSVPSGTYLMWLDFGAYNLEDAATDWMVEHAKVAMNGGKFFGEEAPGFVRLNFGCPRATLADALDRISEALSA